MVRVQRHFKHASSGYIMPEEVKVCQLGQWRVQKRLCVQDECYERSLRLEAVQKFWRMISKSIQLMSICSTVNRELQGIQIGGSSSFRRQECVKYVTFSKTIIKSLFLVSQMSFGIITINRESRIDIMEFIMMMDCQVVTSLLL